MLVIGLTGGIATGKSTVSNILQTKNIPLVDADVIAREVVAPGTPGLKKIVKTFGEDILLADGSLDRKKLGSIVFNDGESRKKLNAIVHPAVRWAMVWSVVKHWRNKEKYCVLDVPLLIENGLWKWVGMVVVVFCPPRTQLERLMARDNSTNEEANARLTSQISITEKLRYADVVIDNSRSLEELRMQVDSLVNQVEAERGRMWLAGYYLPFISFFSAIWWLARRKKVGEKED